MTKEEYFTKVWEQQMMNNQGCFSPTMYACGILIAVIMLFTSCATKKRVVETGKTKIEVTSDSTNISSVSTDSISDTQKTTERQTEVVNTDTKVEKSDSTVLTVDKEGNVIKQETWHKEKETVSRNREYERELLDSLAHFRLARDALRQYQVRCDSLTEILNHKEKEIAEVSKVPKIYKFSLIISIFCLTFAFVKLVRWLNKWHKIV